MAAKPISEVIVLGGGSAGLIAALTLRIKAPHIHVRVIRSPDIGIIGVGEGTTVAFPRFFFEYLKMEPRTFYDGVHPTWKLGIKFIWGPRQDFYYTFAKEYEHRWPDLSRNVGFFHDDDTHWVGPVSALMAHGRAFQKRPDGTPHIHNSHAFHIENHHLVSWLEKMCRDNGCVITDGTVAHAETGDIETTWGETRGVTALVLESGERVTGDLFIDASGFRSELLGKALDEPYLSYEKSLFCDRAVIGGWPRTDESVLPYTVAETMDAGWCWQIEHENWINRGYVYSSAFISDEEALAELMRKNPKIANVPRVVKFRSGRRQRNWVGNVVGVGNSVGFVEPLEATALQVITTECSTLTDAIVDSQGYPGPLMFKLYNKYNTEGWDDIRDFLAVHHAFNTRLDTPYWQACHRDTDLAGAAPVVEWYKENGPSALVKGILIPETNQFGFEGYLALLVGQKVPWNRPYQPTPAEQKAWRERCRVNAAHASQCLTVKESLDALRSVGWMPRATAPAA